MFCIRRRNNSYEWCDGKYEKIAAEEATQRTKHQAIRNMLELGLTKEQILKKYSEEDFNEAVEEGKTVMV